MKDEMEYEQTLLDLDTLCGKTLSEHSVQTKAKISKPSSKKSSELKKKMPLFLCLKTANGEQADASWETDLVSLIESTMRSIGECLNEGEEFASLQTSMETLHLISFLAKANNTEKPSQVIETYLSDILEINPDPKYNLSAKACKGILTRANRRGKVLPEILQKALEQTIARETSKGGADIYNLKMTDEKACAVTAAAGISNATSPKVVEALSFQERAGKPGGGKGILVQDEKVGSLGTSPNQATVYSIENHPNDSRVKIDPTGKVQTLSQRMGTGGATSHS